MGRPFGHPGSPDNCQHPANFTTQELQAQGVNPNEATIVLDSSFPFRIRYASDRWLSNFHFERSAVVGRSLKLVHGPGTDAVAINQMLNTSMGGKDSEDAMTLYTSEGQPSIYCTKSRALFSGCDVSGIALTMTTSDAVPYKVAYQEFREPMVIVSATEPHSVDTVNAQFTEMFGFSEPQVSGRSLRVIQGPKTDMFAWSRMFKTSRTGLSKSGWFTICTANCTEIDATVVVQPVFASGGKISHLKVTFQRSQPIQPMPEPEEKMFIPQRCDSISVTSGFDTGYEMPQEPQVPQIKIEDMNEMSSSFRPVQREPFQPPSHLHSQPVHSQAMPDQMPELCAHRPIFPPVDPIMSQGRYAPVNEPINIVFEDLGMPRAPFAGRQDHALQVPNQKLSEHEAMFKIFPRRKNGQDAKDSLAGPVCITLEVLEQCADMSLCEFAKRHGISATAVKRACRKLGVQRWPYKKNGDQVQSMVTDGMDVESAAWKMFRKYAAKASRESKKAHAKPAGDRLQLGSWQSQSCDTSRIQSEAISPVNSEDYSEDGDLEQVTHYSQNEGMEVNLVGMQMQHTTLGNLGMANDSSMAAPQPCGLSALERLSLEQPFYNPHQGSLDEAFASWANF
mmetsp:Transcript_45899/g.71914  ORF Transcript_45899/g.71914 Transcript_45899/m.71914 type:complete len:620 (+) Transcript_45899:2-1861(+)